jgi:TldD protein
MSEPESSQKQRNTAGAARSIDPAFSALPARELADAALEVARRKGAKYADFRLEYHRRQTLEAKERDLERVSDSETLGFAVRVLADGAWGFQASDVLSADAAADAASRAVDTAKSLARVSDYRVRLAPEEPHKGEWVSEYSIDPFDVSLDEKVAYLLEVNDVVLSGGTAKYCSFWLDQVKEIKFLCSSEGTETTQQRVRMQGNFQATTVTEDGELVELRSNAMPQGRGFEFVHDYDFKAKAGEHNELLAEKCKAKSVEPGRYDLVIDPTNLWLTIHESIGHATELDRALGFEANYAGTSFATPDKLGSLGYGSECVTVIGDRTQRYGLATIGWDDDGVEAQSWDIIRDGIFVGYQYNREIAAAHGLGRSNGCAYADSWEHVPIQRMANVSLQPAPEDITLEELLSQVDRGIYIVGDNSWSIDMKRLNFQFTGQLFYLIEKGRIVGMLKDVAYQGNTIEFWNSCAAVGGPSTYVLGGAFNCGKGQPGQVAPVSHGAPVALFRNVNVLNTGRAP